MSTSAMLQSPGLTPPASRWWLLPSWLISLLLHAVAVVAVAAWLREVDRPPVGFGDEPGREVGIVLKSLPQAASVTADEVPEQPGEDALDPAPIDEAVPTSVPRPSTVAPMTPTAAEPVGALGVGPLFPTAVPGDPRELIQSAGTMKGTAGQAIPIPGAAFMGARDNGTRVVFVIDCSASMQNHNAMRSAKAALVASLQSLVDTQQFQVLFYNQQTHLLRLRGTETKLLFATELHKTLARQQISGIQPDLGTDHLPALKLALRLQPEVLFFLTDADEPQLSAGELQDLQRLNAGRTRIHTIEFGTGGELNVDNFLKKLARQNDGTYRYYDVKRLGGEGR
jgi:Ca-activated chloride channel family protein